MVTRERLTAEDLLRLGQGDLRRELVDGEVIEMAPHIPFHGRTTGKAYYLLEDHVRRHGGGVVMVGDVGFKLGLERDPERVRAPDIAFVSRERLPGGELPRKGFFEGAPDLAVEILSPSDDADDVQQRVRDYLEAGTRLVWILAAGARTVTVYRPDGSARLLREHETLGGEDVLPGLQIPLTELFD